VRGGKSRFGTKKKAKYFKINFKKIEKVHGDKVIPCPYNGNVD
jgi:hypothetical protein